MNDKNSTLFIAAEALLLGVSACENSIDANEAPPVAAQNGEPASAMPGPSATSPGKPTAPIDISYEVIGTAIVGVPVSINIVITSARGPINVEYSIVDNSA